MSKPKEKLKFILEKIDDLLSYKSQYFTFFFSKKCYFALNSGDAEASLPKKQEVRLQSHQLNKGVS